jgi:hypothetical protein
MVLIFDEAQRLQKTRATSVVNPLDSYFQSRNHYETKLQLVSLFMYQSWLIS